MTHHADEFVEAAEALKMLGRHLQRTFPPVAVDGCQHGEQAVLDKLLPGDSGIYVDIGAHSPVDCSNTVNFYRRGWRGLLIEPLSEAWPALLMERGEDYLSPVAASDVDGYATLNVCRSVSSLDSCWRKDNESRMPVRTERLETILKRYTAVDWSKTRLCSMDVEGHEKQVLSGIDWNTFKPEVFICEWASDEGVDLSGPWLPILLRQGYREVYRNGLNVILKRA